MSGSQSTSGRVAFILSLPGIDNIMRRSKDRAIDASGNVQPAMNDPTIAKKHTYWESNGQVTRHIRVG